MRSVKFIIYVVVSLIIAGCNKEKSDSEELSVRNISFSECLFLNKSSDSEDQCLILYTTDKNYLKIRHLYAEFCCGTQIIEIDLKISNDSILINEIDLGPYTYCYCKHNLEYELGPLNYKDYIIKIIESINSYSRDTLIYEINFSDDTDYNFCEE